jgi:hypothetical protein
MHLPKKTEPANARDGDNVRWPVRLVQEKEMVEFMDASSYRDLPLYHRLHVRLLLVVISSLSLMSPW